MWYKNLLFSTLGIFCIITAHAMHHTNKSPILPIDPELTALINYVSCLSRNQIYERLARIQHQLEQEDAAIDNIIKHLQKRLKSLSAQRVLLNDGDYTDQKYAQCQYNIDTLYNKTTSANKIIDHGKIAQLIQRLFHAGMTSNSNKIITYSIKVLAYILRKQTAKRIYDIQTPLEHWYARNPMH